MCTLRMEEAMKSENYQSQMHYQIMGIGMTLYANKKESPLFQVLNDALTRQDWVELEKIKLSFDALSPAERTSILRDRQNPMKIADAISHLEMRYFLDYAA